MIYCLCRNRVNSWKYGKPMSNLQSLLQIAFYLIYTLFVIGFICRGLRTFLTLATFVAINALLGGSNCPLNCGRRTPNYFREWVIPSQFTQWNTHKQSSKPNCFHWETIRTVLHWFSPHAVFENTAGARWWNEGKLGKQRRSWTGPAWILEQDHWRGKHWEVSVQAVWQDQLKKTSFVWACGKYPLPRNLWVSVWPMWWEVWHQTQVALPSHNSALQVQQDVKVNAGQAWASCSLNRIAPTYNCQWFKVK